MRKRIIEGWKYPKYSSPIADPDGPLMKEILKEFAEASKKALQEATQEALHPRTQSPRWQYSKNTKMERLPTVSDIVPLNSQLKSKSLEKLEQLREVFYTALETEDGVEGMVEAFEELDSLLCRTLETIEKTVLGDPGQRTDEIYLNGRY